MVHQVHAVLVVHVDLPVPQASRERWVQWERADQSGVQAAVRQEHEDQLDHQDREDLQAAEAQQDCPARLVHLVNPEGPVEQAQLEQRDQVDLEDL